MIPETLLLSQVEFPFWSDGIISVNIIDPGYTLSFYSLMNALCRFVLTGVRPVEALGQLCSRQGRRITHSNIPQIFERLQHPRYSTRH